MVRPQHHPPHYEYGRKHRRSCHFTTARTDNDYPPTTTTTTNNNNNNNNNNIHPNEKTYFPPGTLGPPEPIRSLKIGESIAAYRYSYSPILHTTTTTNEHENGSEATTTTTIPEEIITNFNIERVSYTPDAFVLRNFLTEEECHQMMDDANHQPLAPAETITKGDFQSRKKCQVSWIPSGGGGSPNPNNVPYVSSLVKAVAKTLLSRTILSHAGAGVEDLQVLKYDVGGEFVLHHDGESRILTVIYYVNGVAGTWFPLARTDNDICNDPLGNIDDDQMQNDFQSVRNNPQSKEHAMTLGEGYEPGKDGLLVKGYSSRRRSDEEEEDDRRVDVDEPNTRDPHVAYINRGDALAFYNFCDDGSARLNWRALHTGLPTNEDDGVKWLANHWFRSETPQTHP